MPLNVDQWKRWFGGSSPETIRDAAATQNQPLDKYVEQHLASWPSVFGTTEEEPPPVSEVLNYIENHLGLG